MSQIGRLTRISGVTVATGRRLGLNRAPKSADRLQQLGEWFAVEYESLLRFAYVLTGERASAEDLVQDAFLRIFRAGGRTEEVSFHFYARKTILNLARSSFRRARIARRVSIVIREDVGADPADTAAHHDVRRALLRLPFRQRACLALRFYEDRPDDEIAELLGTSRPAVRKQVERAMKRLRDELGEDSS